MVLCRRDQGPLPQFVKSFVGKSMAAGLSWPPDDSTLDDADNQLVSKRSRHSADQHISLASALAGAAVLLSLSPLRNSGSRRQVHWLLLFSSVVFLRLLDLGFDGFSPGFFPDV